MVVIVVVVVIMIVCKFDEQVSHERWTLELESGISS